jgi:hypothetical protein
MIRPVILAAMFIGAAAGAQDYRARIDARMQSIWFRGLTQDSIPSGSAVATGNGGFTTADGHAVRCTGGEFCFFFKPGARLHGMPVAASANISMWGFGVEGLSLRASGRVTGDLGDRDAYPGTEPALQLIEGLVEYQRSAWVARGGRQLVFSRLEPIGFDGGWLRYRIDRASLEITGYGGWGLGRSTVVSELNPALNPLDEFRPRNRQLVAGAEAAWLYRETDLRAEYRREIDPRDDYFVSERAALSLVSRFQRFRLNGGIDYNIAEGRTGSADATVVYIRPRYSVSAGVRRYRPYFSLWTLWGAFSAVPYNAANISGEVRPRSWLALRGRAERYRYEDAQVSTALVTGLEDRGWRARLGATATVDTRWTFDGNYGVEHGPGASSRYADVSVRFSAGDRITLDAFGGTLARPLELRFYDATSRWIGGRAQIQQTDQRRLWAEIALVDDDRDRPDAGNSSLEQVRIRAGLSVAFGSAADRTPLPPARPSAK